MRGWILSRGWLALCWTGAAVGCDDDGQLRDCANDVCTCAPGRDCELTCSAPPCNVVCDEGSRCEATCANGSCRCEQGASCSFSCESPPCHVRCAGDHRQCDGTCANGTCACGPNSSCHFVCESGPCHTECAVGAECTVACPNAMAGTQDCDIVACAAGAPVICPGGRATTCNAPCPDDAGLPP